MNFAIKQWQRVFGLILALSLVISAAPFAVYAAEEKITCETETVVTDLEFPDNEEMYSYYVESLFYPESMPCLMGTAAGDRLTGDTKVLYDVIVPIIKEIACGNRESTQIGFGRSLTYDGESFNSDYSMTFSGSSIDTGALFKALLLDMPYEMYWADKVSGCKFKYFKSGGVLIHVTMRIEVADVFQGSSTYSVDTSKARASAAAVSNANAIVENNKDKTDYEKLVAYRDAICGLVSYDNVAAGSGSFSLDNRAWQLVNVFDGDNTTNVVCEGYSKAFKYLCDLTSFAGDVACYCVSGDLISNSGSGGHMWNIVTLEGNNYLVDVTNSDAGTVGYYDSSLFLAGTTKGSADTSYTFKAVSFAYDDNTKALWGTDGSSFLTLASSNYEPKTTYTVTYDMKNIISDGASFAAEGSDYSAILQADAGYALPDNLGVSIGGVEFAGFFYDSSSGALMIPAADVTGNILIFGAAVCTHERYEDGACSVCGKICEHTAYENGFCIDCGAKEPVIEVQIPEITLKYPTLSFESEVFYNVYFTVANAEVNIEDLGLLTWYNRPVNTAAATYETAEAVIPGAVYNEGANVYMVRSEGVPAKQLGDNMYFRVYAKLSDGTYAYSPVTYYSAKFYADSIFSTSTNENMKALCVAMLNYGSAAQVHFNYKTEELMNASLSDEQKALVQAYSADMIGSVISADPDKVGTFKSNGGFSGGYPSVSFEGAFSINYYLTPKMAVEGDMTLYCWDQETYNSVDVLTEENATSKVVMTNGGTQYVGSYAGIAAKQIDGTVFVAAVYESNGVRYSSPVISYSLGAYCKEQISGGSDTMKEFAKETAVYGYYAKAYFA